MEIIEPNHPIKEFVIVTPVYNDSESLQKLISEINDSLERWKSVQKAMVHIIGVEDGSQWKVHDICFKNNADAFSHIASVEIIDLVRNVGHQKAIAIGLAYAQNTYTLPVIVMDCDGEDRPDDIPRLLELSEQQPEQIVFAERKKRSEGLFFICGYLLYKLFFYALTGKKIFFGNFSIVPYNLLRRTVFLPEIWNHYAAGIMRSGIPRIYLPTRRGKRYLGKSKMNYIALILHGMSAISVYIEIAAIRMIIFALSVVLTSILGFAVLLYIRLWTDLAIPGWATNVAFGLMMISFQSIFFLVTICFLVLNFRSNKLFIPFKDYTDFILTNKRIYPI